MAFTNGARRAMHWLRTEVGGLLRRLLGVPDEVIRTDVPHHPEIWGDICGWYRFSTLRSRDARQGSTIGAGAEVFVRGGQLMLRVLSPIPALYRGFPLHPDDDKDPYVFRIDLSEFGIGTGRVIFSREPGEGTTALHLDFAPLSSSEANRPTNPRRGPPARLARSRWPPLQRPFGGKQAITRSDRMSVDDHRPLAYERHGAGRCNQIQANVQSRSHRVPPAADRGREPLDQRRHGRSRRAGSRSREDSRPDGRQRG